MSEEFDTAGRRRVRPPTETQQYATAGPMEVWLFPNERVKWLYSYGTNGRQYVTGFVIYPADNDPSSTSGGQTWRT